MPVSSVISVLLPRFRSNIHCLKCLKKKNAYSLCVSIGIMLENFKTKLCGCRTAARCAVSIVHCNHTALVSQGGAESQNITKKKKNLPIDGLYPENVILHAIYISSLQR